LLGVALRRDLQVGVVGALQLGVCRGFGRWRGVRPFRREPGGLRWTEKPSGRPGGGTDLENQPRTSLRIADHDCLT
jgi:hypothetical protein